MRKLKSRKGVILAGDQAGISVSLDLSSMCWAQHLCCPSGPASFCPGSFHRELLSPSSWADVDLHHACTVGHPMSCTRPAEGGPAH